MIKRPTRQVVGSHPALSAKGHHPHSDRGFGSVLQSHGSPIGSCIFFPPEIESIENRQTHSCQFVQSCGFCRGYRLEQVYPIMQAHYFSSCGSGAPQQSSGFKQMNNKLKGTVK